MGEPCARGINADPNHDAAIALRLTTTLAFEHNEQNGCTRLPRFIHQKHRAPATSRIRFLSGWRC
jgi:hypothetical protein